MNPIHFYYLKCCTFLCCSLYDVKTFNIPLFPRSFGPVDVKFVCQVTVNTFDKIVICMKICLFLYWMRKNLVDYKALCYFILNDANSVTRKTKFIINLSSSRLKWSFHIWYIASSRGPQPKLFQLCPWGQN